MSIKLYNSFTNQVENFVAIDSGKVKIYSCGPTVYDYPHIGNYRSFIFSDFLHRFFLLMGYETEIVMNITDIDDKTIKSAVALKKKLKHYTATYIEAFFSDLKQLNFRTDKRYPLATEHVSEIIEMIKTLIKKEYAYEVNGSVYFSLEKFPKYGRLSNLNKDNILIGKKNLTLNDEYQKDNVSDFVLWKTHREEDGDNYFISPWGKGRPGWHIECSVMSKKYLGDHFDIHTGGIDNRFPHHENEIAQSQCVNDKKFVNYWLHVSHLLVEEEKMSKSLGNFYTLNDLLQKGYNPLSIKYMLLSTHYRHNYNFTLNGIKVADTTLKKVNQFIKKILEKKELTNYSQKSDTKMVDSITKIEKEFIDWLCDDLNISAALGSFFNFINMVNKKISILDLNTLDRAWTFIEKVNSLLGVFELNPVQKVFISSEVESLFISRNKARVEKDYQLADKLRKEIEGKGFLVEDRKEGPSLIPK